MMQKIVDKIEENLVMEIVERMVEEIYFVEEMGWP